MLAAAGRGWLRDEKGGNFCLTDPGCEVIEGIYELCGSLYLKFQTLPDQEIRQVTNISDRVVASIKELDELDQKSAFELSLIYIGDQCRSCSFASACLLY
jgi:hypothetical protein